MSQLAQLLPSIQYLAIQKQTVRRFLVLPTGVSTQLGMLQIRGKETLDHPLLTEVRKSLSRIILWSPNSLNSMFFILLATLLFMISIRGSSSYYLNRQLSQKPSLFLIDRTTSLEIQCILVIRLLNIGRRQWKYCLTGYPK